MNMMGWPARHPGEPAFTGRSPAGQSRPPAETGQVRGWDRGACSSGPRSTEASKKTHTRCVPPFYTFLILRKSV